MNRLHLSDFGETAARRSFYLHRPFLNVCYWHKADMLIAGRNVRYWLIARHVEMSSRDPKRTLLSNRHLVLRINRCYHDLAFVAQHLERYVVSMPAHHQVQNRSAKA